MHWQPSASLAALQQRALLYSKIRDFFARHTVLEVETPLLSHYGVTDAYIDNIPAHCQFGAKVETAYLQTSPEYAMKRLLANEVGSIYQICKAFRSDEHGQLHNPEFTMLEWYRPGFDHHALMQEMDTFLQFTSAQKPAEFSTYEAIFLRHLNINPHFCDLSECLALIEKNNINLTIDARNIDKDTALQLLMNNLIEPHLGLTAPIFIYDFPSTQAALAKISVEKNYVAERFEVYIKGIEIANGFNELTDAKEQIKRFQQDQSHRMQRGSPYREIDPRLIAALEHGLPPSAGVALGIDRLLMVIMQEKKIDAVLAFPWQVA